MGDVVNLNRARKAKAKRDSAAQAAANRAAFGRTKMAKKQDAERRDRAEKHLDGLLCSEKHGLSNLDLDQCK